MPKPPYSPIVMNAYTYVTSPNINLLCCICRTPFVQPLTTRTCSHTFCRECIVTALSIVPQCPIDRSPLTPSDLLPADPLVRNLIDELEVECPNRSDGCKHICQRQLLASHVEEDCLFQEVSCQDRKCDKVFPRRISLHELHAATESCKECGRDIPASDYETHMTSCKAAKVPCETCGIEIQSTDLKSHQDQCPDVVISCTHGANGCPWKGPRYQIASHVQTCPYEAIKGFLVVHERQRSSLTEENAVLRNKLEALEGVVNTLKREMDGTKAALGPWYRPEVIRQHTRQPSFSAETALSSGRESMQGAYRQYADTTQPTASTSVAVDPLQSRASATASHTDATDLASYFPPVEDMYPSAGAGAAGSDYPPFNFSPSPSPSSPPRASSRQAGPAPRMLPLYTPYPQIPPLTQQPVSPQPTPVAPLDLSTTLEGALSSLRESVVTLSASMDSLGRRQEVAVTTEAMRTAEELRSLRAVVHGLRMQVHAIMMDHNTQVTGRAGDASSSMLGTWPPPDMLDPPPWMVAPYAPRHPAMAPAPPTFTKL